MARKPSKAKRPARPARKAKATAARTARKKVAFKPAGLGTVTPNLVVKGCSDAIEWWKEVFGAKERSRTMAPGGQQVWHAELRIGESTVMTNDAMGQDVGAGNTSLMLYVKDADVVYQRALENGAQVVMPISDAFWGDRYGMVKDPYGIHWAIATHQEDLRPAEIRKRGEEFARKMAEQQGQGGGPPPTGV